ncbi:MAG: CofH family radical SAM protein [Cyanobacteria bacterium M_surface_10_m1_298]|nr:CofH family radical SAM protein [Cyanobacteria bacterium M_surface_10_m1_298]
MTSGSEAFEPWAWRDSAAVLAPVEAIAAEQASLPVEPWDLEQQEQLRDCLRRNALSPQTFQRAHALLHQQGGQRLQQQADALRRALVGETVSYVRNRNLNFTNHCVQHCSFCAFRRDPDQPGAYWHRIEELQHRASEAANTGASELCLQGGLNTAARLNGSMLGYYAALLRALRDAAPGLHLHAFSPQELLFIAREDGISLQSVLESLCSAGLDSVPGTAAEVLSEPVRHQLCPEKLTAREWCAVVLQVHRSGLPSTSTLMAGHIEAPADRAAHLLTLVALQQQARQHQVPGFSEFVLLPFIGANAPAALRRRVGRDQPDRAAMLALTAQSRLLLGEWIVNHQPSWVKLTLEGATEALRWGCNDLGGTLMEESITSMAGAEGGTSQSASALEAAARSVGRPVRERTTLYGERR